MMTVTDKTLHKAIVRMPRLNSNEDEAKIARILVKEGQSFGAAEQLFSLETTKAAIDVEAPCAGMIVTIMAKEGEFLSVGAPLCHIMLTERGEAAGLDVEWVDSFDVQSAPMEQGEARISTKAKLLAQSLGVDWTKIPSASGIIRIQDVETHHAAMGGSGSMARPSTTPVLQSRYDPLDAVIFGGGGHARALMDTAQGSGYRIIGAIDAVRPEGTPVLAGLKILGGESLLQDLFDRGVRTAFVGVGGATSNQARANVYHLLSAIGFSLPPLVARSAHLGMESTLGEATYLFPGASVGPAVRIGNNCIINQNVVIAHDSVIGDHVHLAPNAVVAGHCRVGTMSTIGMCATVMNQINVGENCLIHNNVALTQDVATDTIMTARGALPQPTRTAD